MDDWDRELWSPPGHTLHCLATPSDLRDLVAAQPGQKLHVLYEPLGVSLWLSLLPWTVGVVHPTQTLYVRSIVAQELRRGHGTRMLQILRDLTDHEGWGCFVSGPFTVCSQAWLEAQAHIQWLPSGAWCSTPHVPFRWRI